MRMTLRAISQSECPLQTEIGAMDSLGRFQAARNIGDQTRGSPLANLYRFWRSVGKKTRLATKEPKGRMNEIVEAPDSYLRAYSGPAQNHTSLLGRRTAWLESIGSNQWLLGVFQ
jgi:hypothetical protein